MLSTHWSKPSATASPDATWTPSTHTLLVIWSQTRWCHFPSARPVAAGIVVAVRAAAPLVVHSICRTPPAVREMTWTYCWSGEARPRIARPPVVVWNQASYTGHLVVRMFCTLAPRFAASHIPTVAEVGVKVGSCSSVAFGPGAAAMVRVPPTPACWIVRDGAALPDRSPTLTESEGSVSG